MASHHPELDSGANSVASSPRSDHPTSEFQARMRFMCSFGGKILPRPHDNQLRYVGGDTRIVAVNRNTTFSAFISKLSKLSGIANVTVKYQLPNEDLDALISVTTDEDIENMMEEYDRLAQNQNPRSARLRLFLFPKGEEFSRTSSISSLLDGSANRGHWFLDALNAGGGGLERGRSEASSIVSEVPDYLFGLDNSDENHIRDTKLKARSAALNDNVSASDPGSPAPVVSSPYCSTSSVSCVPTMPNLPPVKTKPDNQVQYVGPKESQSETEPALTEPTQQPAGYPGQTMWHYPSPGPNYAGPSVQQMPVYYVQGPVPTGNMQVQQQMPVQTQYVPQYQAQPGQMPMGYSQPVPGMGQAYGGAMRPAFDPYNMAGRVGPDGVNPQVYYGNSGLGPGYSGLVVPGGEDRQGTNVDPKTGRFNQPS